MGKATPGLDGVGGLSYMAGNAGNAGRGWSSLRAVLCVLGFNLLPGCCAAPQGSAFPAARLAAVSSRTDVRTRLHVPIPP